MKLVLDSSFIVKLLLPEKDSDSVQSIVNSSIEKDIDLVASELAVYEVGNVIWKHLRRTDKDGAVLMERLRELNIVFLPLSDITMHGAMKVAQENNITYYDAVHVFLADSHRAPLLTEDGRLLRTFNCAMSIPDALRMVRDYS